MFSTANYRSTAVEPSNANRLVTLTVMDDKIDSDPRTVTVTIRPTNNNPPTLSISVSYVNFTEGDEPISLISESNAITISDPDCSPVVTRATVTLDTAHAMYEWLSVSGDLPVGVTAVYYPNNRTLTIEGPGDYRSFLSNVVYGNNMSEPQAGPKTVTFKVFDGSHYSNEATVSVRIHLVNDNPPSLDLDSTADGTGYTATYQEGSPAVRIVSNNVQVSDADSGTRIHTVTVSLQNVQNGDDEEISTTTTVSPVRTNNSFTFTFSQPKTPQETEEFLNTLLYNNSHVEPTPGTRHAEITINDGDHDSNVATTQIEVTTINDQPPVFSQAPYSGSVPENSVEHTSVATVMATDADSHVTNITYAIVHGDDRGHFKINVDGLITTTSVPLDREQDDSYTLTVQASDGNFDVDVPVAVTVTDVNDNCPAFSTKSYSKTISSAVGVNSIVVSLLVTDEDANSVYEVAIIAGNGDGLFQVTSGDGDVTVATDLSGFTFTSHSLTVLLSDPSLTSQNCSDTATVAVVIFSTDLQAEFSVSEDEVIGTNVGQIITDPAFPDTAYNIIHPTGAPFSIDGRSNITTTEMLDREDVPVYMLVVQFLVGSQTLNVTVRIEVTDVNDNSPVFTGLPYRRTVAENAAVGQEILTVTATDGDAGPNGQVTYTLSGSTPFNVSSVDGVVSLKAGVNYETQCMYTFDVTATDGGDPSRSTIARVMVNVTDVNEFHPRFEPSSNYSVEITEARRNGSAVVQVTAEDDDKCPEGPPTMISYSFVGVHLGFAIDSSSGEIRVSGDLQVGVVTLTVRADDGKGLASDATVNVNVIAVSKPVVDLNGDESGVRHVTVSLQLQLIVPLYCR